MQPPRWAMPTGSRLEKALYVVVLLSIPFFSLLGNPLRIAISDSLGGELLPPLLTGTLVAMVVGAGLWIYRTHRWQGLLVGFLLGMLLLGVLQIDGLSFAERLHFICFGLLGFIGQRLWPQGFGLVLAAIVSMADEGLQVLLPDRFGAWFDVGINLASSCLGAGVAWFGLRLQRKAVAG